MAEEHRGPSSPGVGEPWNQPACESLASGGTSTVPSGLRPRSSRSEETPIAGTSRWVGADGGQQQASAGRRCAPRVAADVVAGGAGTAVGAGRRLRGGRAAAGGWGGDVWARTATPGHRAGQHEQRGQQDGGEPNTSAALLGTGHQRSVTVPFRPGRRTGDAAPAHRPRHRRRAGRRRRASSPWSSTPAVLPPPVAAAPAGMRPSARPSACRTAPGRSPPAGATGTRSLGLLCAAAGRVAGSRPWTTMTAVPAFSEASVAASRVKVRL